MKFTRVAAAAALLAAAGLAGCDSASRAFGLAKVTPDEFRVVTKAPLTLPPDYSLRPPAPGEPRPQELQPESAARQALVGQRQGDVRSDGERLFVTRAGADHADPLVRYVVDDEFGGIAHKDKGFADWVMFWKKGQPRPGRRATASATPPRRSRSTPPSRKSASRPSPAAKPSSSPARATPGSNSRGFRRESLNAEDAEDRRVRGGQRSFAIR